MNPDQLLLNLSPSAIFANLLFSAIGYYFFRHGRRESEIKIVVLGIVLMIYPYFFDSTKALWAIGLILTGIGYWEIKGKYEI